MKYNVDDVEFHCEDCPEYKPYEGITPEEGWCENGKGVVSPTKSHCGYLYRILKEKQNDRNDSEFRSS